MGFTDYSIEGSDTACMAYSRMQSAIAKSLKESLKEEANDWNTNGPENVAMILVEKIIPSMDSDFELVQVARQVVKKLEQENKRLQKEHVCGNLVRTHNRWIVKINKWLDEKGW